jgi:hypothetical protein
VVSTLLAKSTLRFHINLAIRVRGLALPGLFLLYYHCYQPLATLLLGLMPWD